MKPSIITRLVTGLVTGPVTGLVTQLVTKIVTQLVTQKLATFESASIVVIGGFKNSISIFCRILVRRAVLDKMTQEENLTSES